MLLAAVLIIWGMIGYKIWSGLSPDPVEIASSEYNMSFNPQKTKAVDTFSIQTLERDPFLGTLSSSKKTGTSTKVTIPKKTIENLPVINYNGMLKKQSGTDQVFVVNINNNQFLLKKRQTADSITLVKGNDKEISVRYRDRIVTIKRQ